MEIAMLITLGIMGVYFIKSTDIPKPRQTNYSDFRSQQEDYREVKTSGNLPFKMTLPNSISSPMTTPVIASEVPHFNEALETKKLEELQWKISLLENQLAQNIKSSVELQSSLSAELHKLNILKHKNS